SEFPNIDYNVDDDSSSVVIPSGILSTLYNKTNSSLSKSETRPVLTGTCHSIDGDKLTLSATDAFRLSTASYQLSESYDNAKIIVPAVTTQEVNKHLANAEDEIRMSFTEKSIVYDFGNGVVLSSRLLEGAYPDTARLIPESFTTIIQYQVATLREMLKRALLIVEDNPVTFLIKPTDLQSRLVFAGNSNSGFKEDLVIQEASGDDLAISFNLRYFEDALNHFDDSSVINIKFTGSERPFVFNLDGGSESDLDLILPIRVPSNDQDDYSDVVDIEDFNGEE